MGRRAYKDTDIAHDKWNEWYHNGGGRDQMRNTRLKRVFGITYKERNQMAEAQNNLCAICHQSETRSYKDGPVWDLVIDHNHKTGKIRALLCHNCNNALGAFKESIEILKSALEYLQKYDQEI